MTSSTLHLDRLAELSLRYARYSRSAGGLSTVFGGLLLLAFFVVNAYVALTPAARIALAFAPVIWLVAKSLLRRHYYQRDGLALQRPTTSERRQRLWWTAYLVVISLSVATVVVLRLIDQGQGLPLAMAGYLAMVLALPIVAWIWFWSSSDFIVGVLLFCQAAVVLGGHHYPSIWLLYVGLCSAIVVYIGWREHRDYLQLRRELTGAGRQP